MCFRHQKDLTFCLFLTYSIGDKITHPTVVCDDREVILVAFDPTTGWCAHVYNTTFLTRKYFQCLYRVDNEDFPWTQFIGNCSLSSKFLIVTPTTAEHELHLWSREERSLGKKKSCVTTNKLFRDP